MYPDIPSVADFKGTTMHSGDYFEPYIFKNKTVLVYGKLVGHSQVRNINVEVILATLTSGSDSLTLPFVNICSILYSNCVSSHDYTWSVDSHT